MRWNEIHSDRRLSCAAVCEHRTKPCGCDCAKGRPRPYYIADGSERARHSPCTEKSLAPIYFEKFIKRMKRNHYFYTYTLIIILPECVELTCQPITWFSFSFCLVSSFYTDAFLFSLYFTPFLARSHSVSFILILQLSCNTWYRGYTPRMCAWVRVLCVVTHKETLLLLWGSAGRRWQAAFSDGRIKCQRQVTSMRSWPPLTTALVSCMAHLDFSSQQTMYNVNMCHFVVVGTQSIYLTTKCPENNV